MFRGVEWSTVWSRRPVGSGRAGPGTADIQVYAETLSQAYNYTDFFDSHASSGSPALLREWEWEGEGTRGKWTTTTPKSSLSSRAAGTASAVQGVAAKNCTNK